MKRKAYSMSLACALLLFLTACQASPSTEVTPTPEPVPSSTPISSEPLSDDDDTRYFFGGTFLGSWSNGQWFSADENSFTVGELFNRIYYDVWGNPLGAARFYVGEGPGEFPNPKRTAELLEPFGILEGDDFIMRLPGQLTEEAAALTVPDYSFTAIFDGQNHIFTSNVPLTRPSMMWTDPVLSAEEIAQALESVDIHYKDPNRADRTAWLCDIDGDSQDEYLELVQLPRDENYYAILAPGDPIFYAFLLRDDEQISVVTSRFFPYTDDLTAQFHASDVDIWDLDGDGICEIIFCDGEWEGGSYNTFSRIDGTWTRVLCGLFGT